MPTRQDAIDAVEQVLDDKSGVADWEISEVSGDDDFLIGCSITHAPDELSPEHNINGFDKIEFRPLYNGANEDGSVDYDIILTETTRR
ncbi:hypothetical protein [Haloarcula laminariae]|uniref:hypothetical protein n=1 Tax=Haloarcula laminariae TaxID=2961577 RepID=UPI0021CABC53|nr:hypothetical protein [Halomicroarcula laminariae]